MVTLAELREKQRQIVEGEKKGGEKASSDFANFKEEHNLVRFLPGKEDPLDFFVENQVHKYVTPEGKFTTYQCRKQHGEACPVCDLMFSLWDRHRELNLPKGIKSKYGDMATQIKPRSRYISKIVWRKAEEVGEYPVKFLSMSKELFDRVMAAVLDEDLQDEGDPENSTILSLDRGNDFDVVITKKGQYNSFVESKPKIKKSKAGPATSVAAWMEDPLDLKSLIKLESYEDGKLLAQTVLAQLDNVNQKPPTDAPFETDEDNDSKFSSEMKV